MHIFCTCFVYVFLNQFSVDFSNLSSSFGWFQLRQFLGPVRHVPSTWNGWCRDLTKRWFQRMVQHMGPLRDPFRCPWPPWPSAKESTQRCAPAVSQWRTTRSVAVSGSEVKPKPFSRFQQPSVPDWDRYRLNNIEHDWRMRRFAVWL